jgi:hypothetical protein
VSLSFFFRVPEKETAHGMALPARHLINGHTCWSTQHRDDRLLLRWMLRLGLCLRFGQYLDCRPQFIDKAIAIADLPDLPALFDTR